MFAPYSDLQLDKFEKSTNIDCLHSESRDPACSESYNREFLLKVPVVNWADHMEYADEVGWNERLELSTHHNETDILDVSLEIHGLSDVQEGFPLWRYVTAHATVG